MSEFIKLLNYLNNNFFFSSSKTYDQTKISYRVEAVDDEKEPQVLLTTGEHLRRDKTLFSKEKTKLFLKQNVEGSNAMLVVKEESVKKYVHDRDFSPSKCFIGKLPDFEVSKKIQLQQEKSNKKKEASVGAAKKKGKQGDITKYLNNSGKETLTAEEKKEREEKSKKFKEEMEAKRKEKADREAERLKNIQLEKQRIVAKTQATVKELNQIRDDLELTDHRIIPKGKIISTVIEKKYFSDFIRILEFLHSFPEVLSISDKFPFGINMELLERALILKEVNGPLSDILQVLLGTLFSLQIEEENEIDIKYRVNGDVPPKHSQIELMKNASKLHRWIFNHFHMKLNLLVLDSPTLSELLRLHLLTSGAALDEKSSKARFQTRGGYKSFDDPGLAFISKHPHIIKFLSQSSVFQLPTRDILRIMSCLIDQILTFSNLREIIEERQEKSTNARLEYKRIKADEGKRERKVADDKKVLHEEYKNSIAAFESEEQSVKEALVKNAEAELENKIAKIDLLSNKEKAIYVKDLKAQVSVFFNHQTYLGVDRAFRNYYIFESIPGLFVEHDITYSGKCVDNFVKNNPALAHCTKEQRYGIIKQMVTNEENTNDHDKENKVDVNGAMSSENKLTKKEADLELQKELLMCNCDPATCYVHSENIERQTWTYYHTAEEIDALIESLNSRGYREKNLRDQLEANRDLIVDYIKNCPLEKLSFNAEEIKDIAAEVKKMAKSGKSKYDKKYDGPNLGHESGTDANEVFDFYLRQQLLEFEHKLSVGCLGQVKVSDRVLWRKYIEEGEFYVLDENLKWGRASIPNGMANGYAKAGGSSKGSEKHEEESDDDSDTVSSVGDDFPLPVDCSEENEIQIKTNEIEAVKLKSKNLAMALLQIEQGIDIKFVRAPFGPAKERKDKNAMAEALEQTKKRLMRWEESLMKATNYSQVKF
jgi:bromodomain adjacent to zinc finger domain protein 1A